MIVCMYVSVCACVSVDVCVFAMELSPMITKILYPLHIPCFIFLSFSNFLKLFFVESSKCVYVCVCVCLCVYVYVCVWVRICMYFVFVLRRHSLGHIEVVLLGQTKCCHTGIKGVAQHEYPTKSQYTHTGLTSINLGFT